MFDDRDIKNQFTNIVKSINKVCFNKCFNNKEFILDNTCAKICYEKYIKSINIIHNESINIGKVTQSEVITKVMKPNRDLFEEKLIFPYGGTYIAHPLLLSKMIDTAVVYCSKGYNEFLSDNLNR